MSSKEIPVSPDEFLRRQRHHRPYDQYEALMVAASDEIEISVTEMLGIREVLSDAIEDTLDDLETWVWNALVVERLSLRTLSKQLNIPKTTIARIRDRCAAKLRTALAGNQQIQEYFDR